MEKIVKMVAERSGISESQAETAVRTVASFLKNKLPAGLAGQVDNYLNGTKTEEPGLGNQLKGMFGKK